LLAGQDSLPAVLVMARQLPPAFSFELRLAVDLPLWIAFSDDKPQSALQE
jgi:hypothetical protein